jgi:hypothetical protein
MLVLVEKKMLRRIFGVKRESVKEGERELQSEELYRSYSSSIMIRIF